MHTHPHRLQKQKCIDTQTYTNKHTYTCIYICMHIYIYVHIRKEVLENLQIVILTVMKRRTLLGIEDGLLWMVQWLLPLSMEF